MKKKLTSSIVICTRNRLSDIITLLSSIRSQCVMPEECIIVDSSTVPLTDHMLFNEQFDQSLFLYTRLIYIHTTQAGIPHQRNKGIEVATTDIIHFLDDDTVLSSGYVQSMNRLFEHHNDYGGGMGCVTNVPLKQYTIDRLLRCIFFLQRDHASGNFTYSGMPTHAYGTHMLKNVEVLGGCCMSYRRTLFVDHLFDEQLNQYAYLEDADFSWRVSRTHKLFYNPHALLVHNKSPVNRARIRDRRSLFVKNYSYLFFKNIYPHNKLTLFAYVWSISGLFFCALMACDSESLKGYWQGLRSLSRAD